MRLPGAWSDVLPDAEHPESYWTAESKDGTENVSVLRMPWRPTDPQSEWHLTLESLINLRRDVDMQQHGSRAMLSKTELYSDPTGATAMYLLHDPDGPTRLATLMRAAPSAVCVFILRNDTAAEAEFQARAKAVLDATEVTR